MELEKVYQHRTVWMGIAILWIILFHSTLEISNRILGMIREIGYGGVDIFVFSAGVGGYYSYTKDRDELSYFKRRVFRIMPIYLIFMLIWLPFQVFVNKYTFGAVVGNLLMIQGFTGLGHYFNWYLTFLVIIYLLTPILVQIIDQVCGNVQIIALVMLALIMTIPFVGSEHLIIVTRIPLYILGLYFGRLGKTGGLTLNAKNSCFIFSASCAGLLSLLLVCMKFTDYLWNYGLYWYPFLLITPGVCLFISILLNKMIKTRIGKGIYSCLYSIGKCSFEIYLIHIFFIEIYLHFVDIGILEKSNVCVLITLLLVIPASYGLHLVSEIIKRKMKREI